jgi:hypothetical protein
MGHKEDLYFDICKEHVIKQFGADLVLNREADQSFLTIMKVTAQDGGKLHRFNENDMAWEGTDQDFTGWSIVQDGKVFVSYPEDEPEDGGMFFKVGHPREVSELLQLFVHPLSCVTPEEEAQYEMHQLGSVVDLFVPIPDGNTWRIFDTAALPPGEPDGFRNVLHLNLIRDWDRLMSGSTGEAFKICERWPEYVRSLPLATECMRSGYILDPDGGLRSAVDRLANAPTSNDLFLDMLVVPAKEGISAMYLRELLNGDVALCKEIRKAFGVDSSLDAFVAALKAITINLPRKYHHQIRIAAEHHIIRQWLLSISERLASQRGCFYLLAEKHWHVAHTLGQLLDLEQIDD